MKMVQGRLKWTKSRKEYEKMAEGLAVEIAKVSGLRWAVWAYDDKESMATGVSIFEDMESVNAYLAWLKGLGEIEGAVDMEITVWDIQEALSKITRAPI